PRLAVLSPAHPEAGEAHGARRQRVVSNQAAAVRARIRLQPRALAIVAVKATAGRIELPLWCVAIVEAIILETAVLFAVGKDRVVMPSAPSIDHVASAERPITPCAPVSVLLELLDSLLLLK